MFRVKACQYTVSTVSNKPSAQKIIDAEPVTIAMTDADFEANLRRMIVEKRTVAKDQADVTNIFRPDLATMLTGGTGRWKCWKCNIDRNAAVFGFFDLENHSRSARRLEEVTVAIPWCENVGFTVSAPGDAPNESISLHLKYAKINPKSGILTVEYHLDQEFHRDTYQHRPIN